MLWWGDTPVGNRKVTSLYMKTACNLAKENLFALRITHLWQIHKLWLGCFTIKSSKDILQNHCLRTRKQTHCRKYIFTEEIFFTFFFLRDFSLNQLYFYCALSNQIGGCSNGFSHGTRMDLRSFAIFVLFCSLHELARKSRFAKT